MAQLLWMLKPHADLYNGSLVVSDKEGLLSNEPTLCPAKPSHLKNVSP